MNTSTKTTTQPIRLAAPGDAEAIHGIYAPIVRDTVISFEWEPPTVEEMRRRIEKTLADGYPWLVAEVDGQVAGYAYAGRFRTRAAYDWTAEVSVYVDPRWHRLGIGRAVYGRLLRVLEQQGYRAAIGVATAPNPGSEALHRRMGFTEVGRFPRVGWKFGEWHDVTCWRRALGPQDASPEPVRRIGEIMELPPKTEHSMSDERGAQAMTPKRADPQSFRARTMSVSLTVKDLTRSVDWYRDAIGFVIDKTYERDGMALGVVLKAGDVRILLNQDDGAKGAGRDKGVGFSIHLTTAQDVDEIADRILADGHSLETQPTDMPWGARGFRVRDPDGFMLSISSEVKP